MSNGLDNFEETIKTKTALDEVKTVKTEADLAFLDVFIQEQSEFERGVGR